MSKEKRAQTDRFNNEKVLQRIVKYTDQPTNLAHKISFVREYIGSLALKPWPSEDLRAEAEVILNNLIEMDNK
jgi:hypothetical protein